MASATRGLTPQTLALTTRIYKGILTYTAEIPEKNPGSESAEKVAKLLDTATYLGIGICNAQLDPSTLREKTVAIQSLSSTTKNLSQLIEAMNLLIVNVQNDLGLFVKKNLPVSQRIKEHNDKADKWLEQEDSNLGLTNYPFHATERQERKSGRNHVKDKRHLLGPAQFLSETKELASCSVSSTSARGYRDYMEDSNLACMIAFEANGVHYLADLFGVFDGHSGQEVVDYVVSNLPGKLKAGLNTRLKNRPLNDDDLFFCFKDSIKEFHEEVIAKNMKAGTTAVFAFRVIGENRIWTVNIGDSRAFIQRNGRAVPMSIDQKPCYYENNERAEHVLFQNPNEYAKQLTKKGVLFCERSKYDSVLPDVKRGEKMVMGYIGSSRNIHRMILGVPNIKHLDMARSIGDHEFVKWKKYTPENFCRELQIGDQMVLHSDGIDASPHRISEIVHRDRYEGVPAHETADCLVQVSLPVKKDNVTAMIVTFNNPNSFKYQFFAAYTRESPEQLKIRFQQLRLQDPDFFTLLSKNAYLIPHDAWVKNDKQGAEPGSGNLQYGEEQILALLDQPIQHCERFLEILTYKS
jgi:serine/threonine protein phosphatase PrpC